MNRYQKEIAKGYRWYRRFCEAKGWKSDSFKNFKSASKKHRETINSMKETRKGAIRILEAEKLMRSFT